jgi:hypothetical protein
MRVSVALSFGFVLLAMAGSAGPALALEPQDAEPWDTPGPDEAPDDLPPAKPAEASSTLPPCGAVTSDGLPACHLEQRSRLPLVVGGAVVFGLPYALSVAFGILLAEFQGDRRGQVTPEPFFVPVAGPFIALAQAGKLEPLLLLDGLAQTGGVAMIVAGVVWKRTVSVPGTSARVMLTPTRVGDRGDGLALVGTF